MSNNFLIAIAGPHADIIALTLRGFLDSLVVHPLQERLNALLAEGYLKFLIEMKDLEYISSAGVGLISGMALELQRRRGRMVFVHVPDEVYQVLKMTRLTEMLTLASSRKEAMDWLEPEDDFAPS